MKSTELEAFERFWDHVCRAEQDIRENRTPPTPANWGDPLEEKDEEFLRAYKEIKPHLAKFRRKRLFCPPTDLMLRSGAYPAETAHEALMFFLIKPTEYESARVLSSPEYRAIKDEAQAELKDRQETLEKAAARSKRKTGKQASHENDLGTLFRIVLDHILSVIREEHPKPLKWYELRDRLPQDPKPWSESKICRVMAALLDAPGAKGMTAYRELFRDRKRLTGFATRDREGRRNVDGVVEDSLPED